MSKKTTSKNNLKKQPQKDNLKTINDSFEANLSKKTTSKTSSKTSSELVFELESRSADLVFELVFELESRSN